MKRITKKITLSIFFLFVFLCASVSPAQTDYQFTGLISPLENGPAITVDWRDHYLGYGAASGEGYGRHPGVDYGAAMGVPVRTIFAGRVIQVINNCSDTNSQGCGGGWGNHVYVEHYGFPGYESIPVLAIYAHLQNDIEVAENEYIRKGKIIGYLGDSGNSTGPHLHFQIDIDGDGAPYYPLDSDLPVWAVALRNMGGDYWEAFKHVNIPDDWVNLDNNDNEEGQRWYVPEETKLTVGYPTTETDFFGIVGNYTVHPADYVDGHISPAPSTALKIGRWDPGIDPPSGFTPGEVSGWDYTLGSFSEKIADCFNGFGGTAELGYGCDHEGGGEWVHEYAFWSYGDEIRVYVQDVCHDTNGHKTICYLPGSDEAFLLQGCLGYLWWEYQNLLGAPAGDETSDTSQFPTREMEDGFDVMHVFQYGHLFWDKETGLVRLISNRGTCEEERIDIDLCVPEATGEPESYSSFELSEALAQENGEWPTCENLLSNSGLDDGPWPMFGHDVRHTRRSEYNAAGPFLKWSYQTDTTTGTSFSSPAVGSNGIIYVGSYYDDYLYAIDSDGSMKWQYKTEGGIQSSPAIGSDGTVYVGSADNYLYAINPNGSLKWRYKTYGWVLSSPTIDSDGTVYVGSDNALYAINSDGTLKWRYGTGDEVRSSPAIGPDGTIYVGSWDGYLYAINPDGTLKWRYDTGSWVSSPAIDSDGTVYVGSYNTYLYAVNPDGGLKWRFKMRNIVRSSSPAIGSDGTIYVGCFSGPLYAVNSNGTLKWSYEAGDADTSPAIGADGTIYVYGRIYVGAYYEYFYAINPDGYMKWRYKTERTIRSSPAIGADGTVYFNCSDGYLYAIGLPEQRGVVYGKITDLSTDDFIANAIIYTNGTSTQSEWDGTYAITLDPEVYDITCSKTGYQTITIPNVVVTVGETTELNIELTVPGPLNIVTTDLPVAETTVEYNTRVRITGGTSPYTYSIPNGSLPPGLFLDTEYGNIVGTPTTTGSYTFAIAVEDAEYGYAEREFTIEVTIPLTIETDLVLPRGTVGELYFVSIDANGGTEPYDFSLSGDLPLDLHLTSSGNICNSITTTVDFNSGVLNKLWYTTNNTFVQDNQLFFDSHIKGSTTTAQIYLDCIGGTISFDYEKNFGCTTYCGEFNFYIDGVRKKRFGGSWSDPTGGHYSIDVLPGPHEFKWESKNFGNVYTSPSAYSKLDNISFPVELQGSYFFTINVTDDSGRTAEKQFQINIDEPLEITTNKINDGIVGETYGQTLSVSGGYGAHSWSVYSGVLPTGLSLDSTSGVLSGTPTEATYVIIVFSVDDEDGRIAFKDFTLEISDPLQILTTTLPNGLKDASYSEAIRLSGGIEPFTFTYVGQLPSGLTLDSDTGIISGIPDIAGYTNVSITVEDSTYPTTQSVTQNLGIRITSMLTVTTSAVLPNAKDGVEMNPVVLVAGGGPSPYVWSLVESAMHSAADAYAQYGLPSGVTLNTQTGELSGTPTEFGDFIFTIQVEDADHNITQKEFFWHISEDLSIVTNTVPDGIMGAPYSFTLSATGGLPHYTWRIKSGSLPSGLSFNEATGTIYGTPTAGEDRTFTIEVNDSDSPAQTAEKTFSMEVTDELFISTKSIAHGWVDGAYTATIRAQLGTPPYSWRLESGDLPPGLVLKSSPTVATIEGTSTTGGTYVFALEVSDSDTPPQTAMREYTVVICACDLNYDRRCDMQDWLLFGEDWGRTDCGTPPGSGNPPNDCDCDLNKDGNCDMQDWLIFGECWGMSD